MCSTTMHITAIIAMLLAAGSNACAQKTNPVGNWKKTVYRELIIQPTETKKKPQDKSKDTSFAQMVLEAIMADKLTAYSSTDHGFSVKYTGKQMKELLVSKPDTEKVVDPVNGKERTVVIRHEIDYEAVYKFRTMEEWTFDRQTGTTAIHITGVAPIIDIYGSDGKLRGSKPICWIRYSDLNALTARYARRHPDKTLPMCLWNDYFGNPGDAQPKTINNVFTKRARRMIDLDPEDTAVHRLRNANEDTSLYDHTFYAFVRGELTPYDSAGRKMTMKDLSDTPDTQTVVDPVTGNETIVVLKHPYILHYLPKYRLVEDWVFDPVAGNTIINITSVATYYQSPTDAPEPPIHELFWVSYSDFSKLLSSFEESHPNQTLGRLLWNDHFVNDVKPAAIN